MSNPLSALIHGDLTVEPGSDTGLFGFGDFSVARNVLVNGTSNSLSATSGAFVVAGGIASSRDAFFKGVLTVSSTSNLQTTNVNTDLGGFNVSGGNAVTISVDAASLFQTTTGDLIVHASSGSTVIKSNQASDTAVRILGEASGSGVSIESGAGNGVDIIAGSGGLTTVTSSGSIALTANNAGVSISANTTTSGQNVTISQAGAFDNQLLISGSGTNDTVTALKLQTANTAGNIQIVNSGGLGDGQIEFLSGGGGFNVTTNTSGPISLTAQAASSSFVVNTANANENLTIGVNGATNSKLILQSESTNTTSAILIQTVNTAGSITITNGENSAGKIYLNAGSSGIDASTLEGGAISLAAVGGAVDLSSATTNTGQDLTIGLTATGVTGSNITISNEAGGTVDLTTDTGAFGISAGGTIQINTTDNTGGINIGTLQNVPVKIGATGSVTTIFGDLDVLGTTTTVESTVVQIADNIIQLNSGPSGTADSGMALKRFQSANDTAAGDVVADVAENFNGGSYNTAQAGTSTTITLAATASAVDDIYAGYWIRIISGTGSSQVRRIKSYNGTSKVATIYSTADQTGVLDSPSPVEGLDFTTNPDATSVYGLFPCAWILSIWDSTNKEYALACSNMIATEADPPIASYIDLHIRNLIANDITVNTINGTTADTTETVTLTDNNTTPVTLAPPLNSGVYFVLVTSGRAQAIFSIGRSTASVTGSVNRLTSVLGANDSQLDIQWNADAFPQLFYRPAPGVAGTTVYTVKYITV